MSEEYFSKLKEVPKGSPEEKLFTLIDDIDTAFDALKPDRTPFVNFVEKIIKEAQKTIVSDGYVLYYYEENKKNLEMQLTEFKKQSSKFR